MAFNADYEVSQGLDPANVTFTDTSTGSDPALTGRTIYLYQTDNTLLGGTPIDWPLSSGSSMTVNNIIIPWDISLNAVVIWTSSAPIPGSVYTKAQVITFDGYSNDFAYNLLQQISSNQAITRDTNYLYNLALVNSDILNAQRCSFYGDQGAAQQAINRIYNFYVNRNYFF